MRAAILGLDCEGQSFDRSKMESGHALGVITFGFQPGQVKTVRTEDQIDNWKNQERRLPASFFVDKLYDSRNRGPQQVVGKRPKVTFGPNRSEEHTSELQSRFDLVCRLLLEKKKKKKKNT